MYYPLNNLSVPVQGIVRFRQMLSLFRIAEVVAASVTPLQIHFLNCCTTETTGSATALLPESDGCTGLSFFVAVSIQKVYGCNLLSVCSGCSLFDRQCSPVSGLLPARQLCIFFGLPGG